MNRERSTPASGGELSPAAAPPAAAPPAWLAPEIIEAHRPAIARWLVWAQVPMGDLPDVMQEIVTAVWQTRARYDPACGTPAAWIRAFTRNIARTYLDSARVRREVPTDPATWPWNGDASSEISPDQAVIAEQLRRACGVLERTPEDEAAAAEQLRRAHDLLARLPPERAEILVRYYYACEQMTDIAASLGISTNTGFSRLRLARAELVREIQREALIQHRREAQTWQSAQTPNKGPKDPV